MANTSSIEHVWAPIPGSSQAIALDTRCHHTLYTGARGPGKTDTQLMRFRRRVGTGYGPFWSGVIFDREYKNLEDIIAKSKRWFKQFDDGAKFLESTAQLKWVWPTGEELKFRVAEKAVDYWKYHGHEYPFVGWNELTKYPTGELYDMMMSVNRSSYRPQDYPVIIDGDEFNNSGQVIFIDPKSSQAMQYLMPELPLEVFSTCNPYGAGHGWVKRRFIDVAPYGTVVRKHIEITDPKTKEQLVVTKTQVAIFGSYVENIYLSPDYIADLVSQTDPNKRKAWLEGDWNIVAGGAFDDVWSTPVHILPRFIIPRTWRLDRSFDWGSTHPFSVGWWAEANGEEAIIYFNGEQFAFCPPPGTLVQFYEWYGTSEPGSNKGIKMSAGDIAQGVIDREQAMRVNGWIHEDAVIWPGPADNQISNVRESDVDTIEKKMADKGVNWTVSDKSPGSRIIGLDLVRERLRNSVRGEGQGLYFMTNCVASTSTIPVLPRDPDKMDDVDTDAEDHPFDMVKYRVNNGMNRLATNVVIQMAS